jgi:hypothetical protein
LDFEGSIPVRGSLMRHLTSASLRTLAIKMNLGFADPIDIFGRPQLTQPLLIYLPNLRVANSSIGSGVNYEEHQIASLLFQLYTTTATPVPI